MKRLGILAALLLAVAAVLWLDRGRPSTDEKRLAAGELAPQLGNLGRIAIDRGDDRVVLLRKDGSWWLGDGTRADDAAAEAVLSTLRYGRVERLVAANLDVKLERAHVVAGDLDLRIGEDAPGRGVYVRRGSELLVAESHLAEVVAADFRSRRAVLEDVSAAKTVQIGALSLEHHAAGWRIVAPRPALADARSVEHLLDAFSARGESFTPAPSPSPGDEVIAFEGRVQAHIRWPFSRETCGKMPQVLRADGAALCFADLSPLQARLDDLRLPTLTQFSLDDIDAVDLEISGKKISLKRVDHEWRLDGEPAEDQRVRERLHALLGLRARAFAPPGSAVIGHARIAAQGEEVTLTLAKSGYEVLAQRASEDGALILPASALKLFDPDPLQLRSLRVDTFRPDLVSKVDADGVQLPHRSPLVDALSNLHAEAIQHRNFAVRRTIRVTAGAVHTFLVGPSDADGCLIKTSEDGPAFVIAPSICTSLYAPNSLAVTGDSRSK
jgi:hypothetical protein